MQSCSNGNQRPEKTPKNWFVGKQGANEKNQEDTSIKKEYRLRHVKLIKKRKIDKLLIQVREGFRILSEKKIDDQRLDKDEENR